MATKVIYNDCFGGFGFNDAFVYAMFKKYPPHTAEGSLMWEVCDDSGSRRARRKHKAESTDLTPGYACLCDKNGKRTGYVKHKDTGKLYFVSSYALTDCRDKPWFTAQFECAACLSKAGSGLSKPRMAHVPAGATYELTEYDGYESVDISIDADTVVKDLIAMLEQAGRGKADLNGDRSETAGQVAVPAPVTALVLQHGSLKAAETELIDIARKLDNAFENAKCAGNCYKAAAAAATAATAAAETA